MSFVFRLLKGRVTYLIMDATKWTTGMSRDPLLAGGPEKRSFAHAMHSIWPHGYSYLLAAVSQEGHSNEAERELLIAQALQSYQLKGKVLLADREYIGEKWFNYLIEQGLDFVIRLPEGTYRSPIDQAPGVAYSKLCWSRSTNV